MEDDGERQFGRDHIFGENYLGLRDKFDVDMSNTDGTLQKKYDLSQLDEETKEKIALHLKDQL